MNENLKKTIDNINNKCYNDYWLIRIEINKYLKENYSDSYEKILSINCDLINDIIDLAVKFKLKD